MTDLARASFFAIYFSVAFGETALSQIPGGSLPSGMTLTCRFTSGPRAGQTQDYSGVSGVAPVRIGSPCTDGTASNGVAISPDDRGEVGGSGRRGTGVDGNSLASGMTLTCRFTSGPRAGQTQDYSGIAGVAPVPVGSPCTDGVSSNGVAIAPGGAGGGRASTGGRSGGGGNSLGSGMTLTCRFTSGPRTGQTQDYSGVAGVAPVPVGSPCTDGVSSNGVAIAPGKK
jgi:hypothetical protein